MLLRRKYSDMSNHRHWCLFATRQRRYSDLQFSSMFLPTRWHSDASGVTRLGKVSADRQRLDGLFSTEANHGILVFEISSTRTDCFCEIDETVA
jgi:hypothetical protein